jgi:hypothetical protein
MSDKTSVVSMSEPGWTVYRIRTESSRYHLSIYDGAGGRPVAVLRGISGDRTIDQADSAPLLGGRLLFGIDVSAWVGHALEMGRVKTSAILDVERESNPILVRTITAAAAITVTGGSRPAGVDQTADETDRPYRMTSADFAYPEDYLIRVERAAQHLSAAYDRTSLVDDLARLPDLMQRFQVALSECLLKVHALGVRATRHG